MQTEHGLIEKIKKAMNEIPLKMVQDAIDNFRSKVNAVEKNSRCLHKINIIKL